MSLKLTSGGPPPQCPCRASYATPRDPWPDPRRGRRRRAPARHLLGWARRRDCSVAGRLVDAAGKPIAEKSFIVEALGKNAAGDKRIFFGENRAGSDGCWPKGDDEAFIGYAQNVKAFVDMHFIEDFATELMAKGRLEAAAIQTIADRHGV